MRGAFDDLPLIRLPFQARIVGGVIRAPSERKVERDLERDANAIFRARPLLTTALPPHINDAPAETLPPGNGLEMGKTVPAKGRTRQNGLPPHPTFFNRQLLRLFASVTFPS